MSKETAAQTYGEFSRRDKMPFTSRIPFALSVMGHYATSAYIAIEQGATGLRNFYMNPETGVPVALITSASVVMYARSILKQRNLDKIAFEIAKAEGRPHVKGTEKFRARTVLDCVRRLSPFEVDRYPNNVLYAIEVADSAAVRINKHKKLPEDLQPEDFTDYIRQEHVDEVRNILDTAKQLSRPAWKDVVEVHKEFTKNIEQAADYIGINTDNPKAAESLEN